MKSPSGLVKFYKALAAKADLLGRGWPDSPAANDFRRLVMARPEDIRRRMLGANVQRRRRLATLQRNALDALSVAPDLLSPLSELRYEPSHSRLIAWFMDPNRADSGGFELLQGFLGLCGCRLKHLPGVEVKPELAIKGGRVDVCVSAPDLLVFVEIKLDALEGEGQLKKYRAALTAQAKGRATCLVFLPLVGGADTELSERPDTVLDATDLLAAWLPIAVQRRDDYLLRYLKSLALVVGVAEEAAWDDWSFATQRAALDFAKQLPKGDA
ncbi:MAG: PD-(D/E)XK nuclease family protein [Planctomycetes bacterium]|nr:PD-(D/E)XK nuclease family protein [Planctomycetota bacterium]MCW8135541.1 PD-(D/E)XK nuclease family protein [Planctomycetota bacterium]